MPGRVVVGGGKGREGEGHPLHVASAMAATRRQMSEDGAEEWRKRFFK